MYLRHTPPSFRKRVMFPTGDLCCALSTFLTLGFSAGISITSAEATATVFPKRKCVTRAQSPSVLIVAAKIVMQDVIVSEESQAPEWTAAKSTLVPAACCTLLPDVQQSSGTWVVRPFRGCTPSCNWPIPGAAALPMQITLMTSVSMCLFLAVLHGRKL